MNTSIVIYDFWRLSVLLGSTPFNAHIWKSPSPKSLFVDKYENDTHVDVYHQYDTYVAEFHKERKMYTSSVADKWCWEVNLSIRLYTWVTQKCSHRSIFFKFSSYIICQSFKKFHGAVFSIAHPKYSNFGSILDARW